MQVLCNLKKILTYTRTGVEQIEEINHVALSI